MGICFPISFIKLKFREQKQMVWKTIGKDIPYKEQNKIMEDAFTKEIPPLSKQAVFTIIDQQDFIPVYTYWLCVLSILYK